ncbi:protein tiptop-like [Oratosquilla oratoria]|uniref:protein tiptop-like n=1 Tax=Oratosquilla oratoria TaxID=337810 RepID=UPI003F76929B
MDCQCPGSREEGEGKVEEGAEGVDGEDDRYSQLSSSPRRRRDSGSVASREGFSPRASPRESVSSSPVPLRSPRSTPPVLRPIPPSSPLARGSDSEGDVLDFSVRRSPGFRDDVQSLASKIAGEAPSPSGLRIGDSPLDLSVPRKRAADALLEAAGRGKLSPVDLAKGLNPWGIPLPPHIASTLALRSEFASLKPDLSLWNGKLKGDSTSTKLPPFPMGSMGATPPSPAESSKALERMSELSKLGGDPSNSLGVAADLFRVGIGSSGRTNAWQSHWLNKGQDATKDVLKCVWCKASFSTLAELTTHMKEAKHCGVNLPPPIPPTSSMGGISPGGCPPYPPPNFSTSKISSRPPSASASGSSSSELMSSIKETMPLPRKLVRGQDVWLGKGAEQTRQILKCMWCGQSFKSLAEMTTHMQQTQHYTNIISQEQIISWKSPEEKSSNQSHVNAVLTCKVCDQAFASLKELSSHMVKYAHYKEHIMRSITESGSRRRQTREKRKKSLPVRKLLELERAQQELRHSSDGLKSKVGGGSITCEKCNEKIETHLFVEHIRTCVGGGRNMLKSALLSPESDSDTKLDQGRDTDSEGKRTPEKIRESPRRSRDSNKDEEPKDSPSVLNAIEKLIEKSFDSGKGKPSGPPLGSSILRRLGIDESVDYSKPLMDPQLAGMYATFSRLHGMTPPGTSPGISLPPSFGSSGPASDRSSGRGPDSVMSPGADSDTRDTFPRSPSRPGSRSNSRPASTGSIARDESASERSVELLHPERPHPMFLHPDPSLLENGNDLSDAEAEPNNTESQELSETQEVKSEPVETNGDISDKESPSCTKGEVRVKDEFRFKDVFKSPKEEEERIEEDSFVKSETGRDSPIGRLASSPVGSSRSGTPHSECSSSRGPAPSGLSGLSALLGGLEGPGSSSHPLAALQKLCDKTETQPRPPPTSSATGSSQATPGAILAFSWACNDAVTADSIMKCAFCDTPFISKGAYRHHLSKMHFVKDGVIPDPATAKMQGAKNTQKPATPPAQPVEESPHSKFLKYTELAKQLSSK